MTTRRWGRCKACDHWVAWTARVPLSLAYCACGEQLARTTQPSSERARVRYVDRPTSPADAARIRERRERAKGFKSERDEQINGDAT